MLENINPYSDERRVRKIQRVESSDDYSNPLLTSIVGWAGIFEGRRFDGSLLSNNPTI
jgi:hypothetical protein